MPGMTPDGRRRAFVGFFGLNRSSRWTAPSVRRHFLAPLAAAGFEVFQAGHFNCPVTIEASAHGEAGIRVRRPGRDFDLDLQWLEPQTREKIAELEPAALSVPFRDYDDPTGNVRRNIVFQMHSLRRLWRLLQTVGPDQFDAFLLLRPDIEYIDPVDLPALEAVIRGEVDLVSPAWHQYGGLNDRFAYANLRGAEVFLNRWDRFAEFCRTHPYIHPESLLGEAVADAGLRVRTTEQRALRVRATGETRAEGFALPKTVRAGHRIRPLIARLSPG